MNKNFIFLGISFVIARNRQDSESVERGSGIWAELRSSISLAHHRPRRCNLGVERDAQDQLFASWPRLSEPGAREELQIPIENIYIYIFSHISNLSNNPSSRSNMTTGRPQINTISDNRLSHFLLYPQINKLIRWLMKKFYQSSISSALRKFISNFNLPSSAQKILIFCTCETQVVPGTKVSNRMLVWTSGSSLWEAWLSVRRRIRPCS